MRDTPSIDAPFRHSHSFLGAGHEKSERKAWAVIWLCGIMMLAEITGGLLFGSIALVADGLHMRRMQEHCCSQRWPTATRANMTTTRALASAPASSAISRGSAAPWSWR